MEDTTKVVDISEAKKGTTIILSEPFKYEDHEFTEIVLNFNAVKGYVLEDVDREYLSRNLGMNGFSPMKQLDYAYCALLASQICAIPYDILRQLPMVDYFNIANAVSFFLIDVDS